jgi:hypothetical protein
MFRLVFVTALVAVCGYSAAQTPITGGPSPITAGPAPLTGVGQGQPSKSSASPMPPKPNCPAGHVAANLDGKSWVCLKDGKFAK